MDFLDDGHGAFHGARALQLQRRALFGHDLGAVRNGVARIERVGMLVGRQKFLHLAGIGQLDVGGDVRNEEAVLADHLWQEHAPILADAIGHQMIIEGFLRVARPAHEPAHVAGRESVGMLGTEVARGIERAVGNHHLHGHAAAGDGRIELVARTVTPTPELPVKTRAPLEEAP